MVAKQISVIDPINRTGKIVVPTELTEETKGLTDFLRQENGTSKSGKSSQPRDLSLCLLFQKGRCNAGSRCHQIHADRKFVTSLREKVSSGTNCCAGHGDVHSTHLNQERRQIEVVNADGKVMTRPISSFGSTQAFENLLSSTSGVVRVPANRLCRLHGQSRCKFGRDCKNVHLCRDVNTNSASSKSSPAEVLPRQQPSSLTTSAIPQRQVSTRSSSATSVSENSISYCASSSASSYMNTSLEEEEHVADSSSISSSAHDVRLTPAKDVVFSAPKPAGEAPSPSQSTTSKPAYDPFAAFSSLGRNTDDIWNGPATKQAPIGTKNEEARWDALLSGPLTKSRIGIAPPQPQSQTEIDLGKLCADMLGSVSDSFF